MLRPLLRPLLFLLVACGWLLPGVFAQADTEWKPEPLRYARIALDENDKSYFADIDVPFDIKDFAPPAGPVGVTAARNAKSILFTSADANWVGDWHPTPRVQYVLVLQGAVDITVETGEVRRFEQGSIFLLEDVRGRGHDSKVVSDVPALFAMIAVPEDSDS